MQSQGFVLASHAPLTEAERGWIDILRAIFPAGVPTPTLHCVQAIRRVLASNEGLDELDPGMIAEDLELGFKG